MVFSNSFAIAILYRSLSLQRGSTPMSKTYGFKTRMSCRKGPTRISVRTKTTNVLEPKRYGFVSGLLTAAIDFSWTVLETTKKKNFIRRSPSAHSIANSCLSIETAVDLLSFACSSDISAQQPRPACHDWRHCCLRISQLALVYSIVTVLIKIITRNLFETLTSLSFREYNVSRVRNRLRPHEW